MATIHMVTIYDGLECANKVAGEGKRGGSLGMRKRDSSIHQRRSHKSSPSHRARSAGTEEDDMMAQSGDSESAGSEQDIDLEEMSVDSCSEVLSDQLIFVSVELTVRLTRPTAP